MLFAWLCLVGLSPSPLPEGWNPKARFQMEWRERREQTHDFSGLLLAAQAGIYPEIYSNLRLGFQISTAGQGLNPEARDAVVFSENGESKRLGLSEAFVEGSLPVGRFEWSAIFGKFNSPLMISPLLWDPHLNAEGLLQSFELNRDRLKVALYAGQFSVDQSPASVVEGTPLRRSWLFAEGFLLNFRPTADSLIRLAINQLYFTDLSENLARSAYLAGNTLRNPNDPVPAFQNDYAPTEIYTELEAEPLGIHSFLQAGGAINFKSKDNERGFYVAGGLGNRWKKDNYYTRISYYYNEPDLTLALFPAPSFGGSNRRGSRLQFDYFLTDFLRFGINGFLGQVLRKNVNQSERKEIRAEVELIF